MNNEKKYYNMEYINIVKDILEHDEFVRMKEIKHHGQNRFDHSIRVSYYSYKISKMLHLDYKDVARAGLLHDFFLVDNQEIKAKRKIDVLINHPRYALNNSNRYFELSPKEQNIIKSHMFPVSPISLPKYIESWVVDAVDDVVALGEVVEFAKGKAVTTATLFLYLMVNYFH